MKQGKSDWRLGLFIACALIWILVFLLDFARAEWDNALTVMHGFCAAAWTVAAVALYRRGKKEK